MHLNFVQHGLYHLAGAFDQMDDGKQDLSVALAELLDDGGRLPGSASHNMVRFLHGGWLLFGVLFGNRILSKPAPPPPTNLQLSPGHHPRLEPCQHVHIKPDRYAGLPWAANFPITASYGSFLIAGISDRSRRWSGVLARRTRSLRFLAASGAHFTRTGPRAGD